MKMVILSGIFEPYTFFSSRPSFFLSFIYLVEGKKSLKTCTYKLPIRPALSHLEGFLMLAELNTGGSHVPPAAPLLPPEQSGRGMLAPHEEPSTAGPENLLTSHQCNSSHQRNPSLLFSPKFPSALLLS